MPLHIGVVAGGVGGPPTVTINPVTNYNQNLATFNATVNPNYSTTSVKFQYSTDGSNWTDGNTVSGLTGGSQSVYSNHTGLSVSTLYYVRAIATNGISSDMSGSTTFITWSLKTYTKTTSGSFTVSVPSVTPTGGSAIAPVIYEMLIYGGGGGANYGGGGGGGYRLFSSHTSSATGTQNVTGTIGAGGAAGNGGTGTGTATTGGSSTISVGSSTWTANGGTAGTHPGNCGAPFGTAGAVGSGDNPGYGGGNNTYGYYYVSSYTFICTQTCFQCTEYNKINVCIAGYNYCCAGYDSPNYSWDCGYYACGGGGGTDAGGTSAYTQSSSSHNGGAGGAGGGAYGLRGGNGGGGYGTQSTGSNGSVPSGSGSIVGIGGQSFGAGVAGGVTFKYYGP